MFHVLKSEYFCYYWIQEADLAMTGITITYSRSTVVDFSIPYHMEASALAIKVESNKLLFFIKPLQWSLYILYIMAPVFLAMVIWLPESMTDVWMMGWIKTFYKRIERLYNLVSTFAKKIITAGLQQQFFHLIENHYVKMYPLKINK